jgi:hypothetical protein
MSCQILAAFFMGKSWPNILKADTKNDLDYFGGIKNDEAI